MFFDEFDYFVDVVFNGQFYLFEVVGCVFVIFVIFVVDQVLYVWFVMEFFFLDMSVYFERVKVGDV